MTTSVAAARPLDRVEVHEAGQPTAQAPTLLGQFLVPCPGCGRPGAAHVDESGPVPTLVRFICPVACVVPAAMVIDHFVRR
jgi:hypothetical protein